MKTDILNLEFIHKTIKLKI